MTEISASTAYGWQQSHQISLNVYCPKDLPIAEVKGFIYVPADDGASVSRLIDEQIVSVRENTATFLTFYQIEFGKNIEFQIMGVDSANNILAGRRGYATELMGFARGGIELTKV